jgi:hypothetical protein
MSLDFLTLEAGTDRLSQNIGKELPFCIAYYLRRVHTSGDLVMQALVWLRMVWFKAVWFGVVWLGPSYMNLR